MGEEEDSYQVDKAQEKLATAITQQQKLANQAAEEEEKKQLAATLKEAVPAPFPFPYQAPVILITAFYSPLILL